MKLHWSPRSPFVRKVMVVAHEHCLVEQLMVVRTVASAIAPSEILMADNPLNKIPTLVLSDGTVLYDSRVICEYFDEIGSGRRLFPPPGPQRWNCLQRQALADGLLDVLLLWRNERSRPDTSRSETHLKVYAIKVQRTLDRLTAQLQDPPVDPDIGHFAVACALSYLDFRFPDVRWRNGRLLLAAWQTAMEARPSMLATAIVDDEAAAVAQPQLTAARL